MPKESAYFKLNSEVAYHDAKELKRGLDAFGGVISVSVNLQKSSLAVDYDNTDVSAGQLAECIETLGYRIDRQKIEGHIM